MPLFFCFEPMYIATLGTQDVPPPPGVGGSLPPASELPRREVTSFPVKRRTRHGEYPSL